MLNFRRSSRKRGWRVKGIAGFFRIILCVAFLSFAVPAVSPGGIYQEQFEYHLQGHAPATSVVHKQFNFHVISSGVWRSSQPNEDSLRIMKRHGLKSVVNLRTEKNLVQKEKDFVESLGVKYFHFPMTAKHPQEPAWLKEILAVVTDPRNQPVLVHCQAGKDRTGLIIALYQVQYLKMNREDVIQAMVMYGFDVENYSHLIDIVKIWPGE